ncbi:MAG TPA: endolytic transglycosylase MltG [Dehalococcoidia bacterium]|nr:endolytic transglycosylase MltG [Dehalococcoidia bacterium]
MTRRVAGIVVTAIALALTGGLAWFVTQTPGSVFSNEPEPTIAAATPQPQTVLVTVKQGESPKAIGDALAKLGIIRSARLFEVLVGVTGVQNALQAGDYEFDTGLPAIEVVRRIAQGKTASREVLIPEGRRVEEVAAILDRSGVVKKQDFLDALVKSRYSEPFLAQTKTTDLEGFIFPATYQFTRNEKPQDVVNAFLQAFQVNVADKLQLEGQNLTLDQVVTLASIVEREAQLPAERPIIASVFLNRLRAGIPLQADPTVQFAVAQDPASVATYGYWKASLTVDDLKLKSPYNTYVNPGLPPGPIANPGFDAIQAVVRPAQTNYLFFVAKGDGSHAFAETLAEHLRNVQKYQSGQ